MNIQSCFFDTTIKSDIVYTSDIVSNFIINTLNPQGICLDPCSGDGSFFKKLPKGSEFCEISEGKDFLSYKKKCDWIIGNPPYSLFQEFLEKSFHLSENVSFLVPVNKIFQRQIIMDMINDFGGIKNIIVFGSGNLIGFPFGFSVANFHFQKKFNGETRIIMGMKNILK